MLRKLLFLFMLFSTVVVNAQWVQTNGPQFGNIHCLCFSADGNQIFAGTNKGFCFSNNSGSSWAQANNALTSTGVSAIAVIGNNIFAANFADGVFLSSDTGSTWNGVWNLPNGYVGSLAVNGDNIFAGVSYGGGICLSTNDGSSWTQIGLNNYDVTIFAIIGQNIFARTYDKSFTFHIVLSTNNGLTWNQIDSRLKTSNIYAFVSTANNSLFAGTDQGILISTDNGLNWNNTGLNDYHVLTLATKGDNIFAGTLEGGIFLSTNNGSTWIATNSGLINNNISLLSINGSNIFAVVNGDQSIWMRPLSEMITGLKDDQNNLPTSFSLKQNFPNPFNPNTIIRYDLAMAGNVTLKVFDILGKEVSTLVNTYQHSGSYIVNFNGSKLASGAYICKIQANNYSKSIKMILMK